MKNAFLTALLALLAGAAVVAPEHITDWVVLLQPAMAAWVAVVSHRLKILEKEVEKLRLRVHDIADITTTLVARADLPGR